MVTIYTDGANSSKQKAGGCSAVIVRDKHILAELSKGYDNNPTNNQMELGGVILGCQYILDHPELGTEVTVVSDSEYVVNGSSKWLDNWKLKNWKGVAGPVKNRELWEAIDYLKSVLKLNFKWTRGHSNDTLNNLADELAVKAYTNLKK